MTGEITLRGRVLPIGGLREKLLAARRAGLKTVLVPARNRADMIEVPSHLQKGMNYVFVEQMDEVLPVALQDKPLPLPTAKTRHQKAAQAEA